MNRNKGLQELKQRQCRGAEDKVYFEMHKLASERHRLKKVRAALVSRIRMIDDRIKQVSDTIDFLDPKNQH